MAFSWNPFSRNRQSSHAEDSASLERRNPNYSTFRSVNNDIEQIVASKSIIGRSVTEQQPYTNAIWQTLGLDSNMLLMPIATNKQDRLAQYRSIARFPETTWCLDEIADEFIHEDENGNFINLRLPDGKENLNEIRKDILQEQFRNYISLFRLRDEGYSIIKRFLVEGELAWENVIDPKQPELGIRGVKFLPAEYYETLIDTKTNRPVGIIFDTEKFAKDIHEILSNTFMGSAQIFNSVSPNMSSFAINKDTCIPMLYSQVTYINSGESSYDGLISYPLIERSRQAYHQLALLQEAAVILRVTRAPERLLYNVGTGRMNNNMADEFVRNFANSLKSKKVAKPIGPNGETDVAAVYNPISMLESYVFAKSADCEGTTVETVGSTADFEQLGDIEYFLRRFMKQFKVPFSRYKTPENAAPTPDQLNYEEYSFLRMIVRFQRQFALGFKRGFITHLKLRDIWDKYELTEADVDISFVKPSMYELLATQQLVEAKMNIYKASLGDDNDFSKMTMMKKYLGMSEAEIKENYENLIKEKMLNELKEYYGGQVAEKKGLAGWETPIQFKADLDSEQKKDSNNADSGNEENEGSAEGTEDENESTDSNENSEETADDVAEEPKEAPAPTFGLG